MHQLLAQLLGNSTGSTVPQLAPAASAVHLSTDAVGLASAYEAIDSLLQLGVGVTDHMRGQLHSPLDVDESNLETPLLDSSINRIFDVNKLGVSTYFLAIIYGMLFVISFLRYRHVNGFIPTLNTSKALYIAGALHLLVRAASFSLISFFMAAGRVNKVWYPLLVMLITFPEYCIISMYVLIFLAWLEIYIFSHHQFILQSRERFRRISRIAFVIASVAVYVTVTILYALLAISKDDFDDSMSLIIEWTLAMANAVFPFIVMCVAIFFVVNILSGFPLSSPLAQSVVKKLHQLIIFWTIGRAVRGAVLFLSLQNEYQKHYNAEVCSIITFTYLTIAEFIPLLLLLDYAMVSIVIVADEVTQASPPVVADDEGLGETDQDVEAAKALLGQDTRSDSTIASPVVDLSVLDPGATLPNAGNNRIYEPPMLGQAGSAMLAEQKEAQPSAGAEVRHGASLAIEVGSAQTSGRPPLSSNEGTIQRLAVDLVDAPKLSDLIVPLQLVAPMASGSSGASVAPFDPAEVAALAGPGAPTIYTNQALPSSSSSFNLSGTSSPTATPVLPLTPGSPGGAGRIGPSSPPIVLSDNGIWISATGVYRSRRVVVKRFSISSMREAMIDQIVSDLQRRSAGLTHPRLVKLLFCARHNTDVYVVQEAVARRSIEDLFRAVDKDLAPVTVLRFATQIASAMDYLHSRNIIHGNLKSSDILLDEKMNVKIADPAMRPLKALAEVSAGRRLVTAYTAPECMTGSSPGKAADVYSFGVICWRMVLRKKPFEGMTTAELVQKVGYEGHRLKTPTAMDLTHTSATISTGHAHPTQSVADGQRSMSVSSNSSTSAIAPAVAPAVVAAAGAGQPAAPAPSAAAANVTVLVSALPPAFVSMISRCFSEQSIRPSFTDILQILQRMAPDINPRAV